MCIISLGKSDGPTWDFYSLEQQNELAKKIRLALFPESIDEEGNIKVLCVANSAMHFDDRSYY